MLGLAASHGRSGPRSARAHRVRGTGFPTCASIAVPALDLAGSGACLPVCMLVRASGVGLGPVGKWVTRLLLMLLSLVWARRGSGDARARPGSCSRLGHSFDVFCHVWPKLHVLSSVLSLGRLLSQCKHFSFSRSHFAPLIARPRITWTALDLKSVLPSCLA
ncbi:hypothetical protein BC567DRAFT_62593 [Phyllosticta citribraziliensis]